MKRHLIIRPSAIGDVILTIPAVKALKEKEGGEVWWVCGELAAPILARYPFIDRVLLLDEKKLFTGSLFDRLCEVAKLWRVLAGVRFDTYVLLQYDARFRLIALPVRAVKTIVLKRGDRQREVIRGRSLTDEFGRILLGMDGPLPNRLGPIPMPGLQSKNRTIRKAGIVPGGAKNLLHDSPLRRWPVDNYVTLAKLLIEQGFEVSLLGAKSDRWTLPAFENLPVIDRLGSLSLVESVEEIAGLDVIVTHDTGLLHMAGLTSTPIVALFGPTMPSEFLPNRENVVCFWEGSDLACRPCYDGLSLPNECTEHFCMRAITPAAIMGAIASLLASSPKPIHLKRGILTQELVTLS